MPASFTPRPLAIATAIALSTPLTCMAQDYDRSQDLDVTAAKLPDVYVEGTRERYPKGYQGGITRIGKDALLRLSACRLEIAMLPVEIAIGRELSGVSNFLQRLR